ncbi:MAG: hypothetical protein K9I96_10495 [Chlorobium sp.]|nr:hypothetical protein [Chlorobium sp.]MCF8217259.1 hypothetical protein [Chlorobium sp.]MCF8292057.1 hypothetical protein [Chlorobium sp.]
MSMDSRQNLVIIKGRDRTDQILRIEEAGDRMVVTFSNGKPYFYARDNVAWLSNPDRIPTGHFRVLVEGDLLYDVEEALRFEAWVKIFRRNGESRCCLFSDFSVQRMASSDGRSTDMLAYFRELAETIGLMTDDNKSMMAMKYRDLDTVSGESILSRFLQACPPGSGTASSDLIFPFGCNMSQKTAVQKAIGNPISLVQGPPGTGNSNSISIKH